MATLEPDGQSSKLVYESKYGATTSISESQYLAEVMCERIASAEGKRLTTRFWQTVEWRKLFVLQTVHVAKLLKEGHSARELMRALDDPRARTVRSWGLKSVLLPVLERLAAERRLQEKAQEEASPIQTVSVDERPRQASARKSVMSMLD